MYVYGVLTFVRLYGLRHPRGMGDEEVQQFMTWLSVERHVSAATHRQALLALLFLSPQLFDQLLPGMTEIKRPQRKPRLPMVMTTAEVRKVLALLNLEAAVDGFSPHATHGSVWSIDARTPSPLG